MESPPGAPAPSTSARRRVMVVADPVRESAGALQWALTHAVVEHDELVLLHVEAPNPRREHGHFSVFIRRVVSNSGASAGACAGGPATASADGHEFLDGMRARCKQAQPRVEVNVERVEIEDNDKATTILAQTRALGVDLLVIGQPRRPWLGGGSYSKSMDMAEYLIENSKCLCVGVQKKGQKAGYVLNTKTHKNFWLLA